MGDDGQFDESASPESYEVALTPAELLALFGANPSESTRLFLALLNTAPFPEEGSEIAVAHLEGISMSSLLFRGLITPDNDHEFELAPPLAAAALAVQESDAWLRITVPEQDRELLVGLGLDGTVSVRTGAYGIHYFATTPSEDLVEAADALITNVVANLDELDEGVELRIEAITLDGVEQLILQRDGELVRLRVASTDDEHSTEQVVTRDALEELLGDFFDEYLSDVEEEGETDGSA